MPNYLDDGGDDATFDDIYQLELNDDVIGGEDGVDNRPHIELAKRTRYLKNILDLGILPPAPGGFDPDVAPLAADRRRLVIVEGGVDEPDQPYIALKTGANTYRWFPIPLA